MAANYHSILLHMAQILDNIGGRIPGFHYDAPDAARVPYLVWAEDSAGHDFADDEYTEKYLDGTMDLICPTGDGVAEMADLVEDVCIHGGIVLVPGDIFRDRDSGLTRWTWTWRCRDCG